MLKHFVQFFLFIPLLAFAQDTLIVEYAHNPYNWPLLHYALQMQRPDVAKDILELYPEQATAKTPALKLMYSHFGNNASQDYDAFLGTYESGISALELAVRYGDGELIEKILDLGADPNDYRLEWTIGVAEYWEPRGGGRIYERVKFPWTNEWDAKSILYWAIEAKNLEVVDLLLSRGALFSPCFASHRGFRLPQAIDYSQNALQFAYSLGDVPLIKKLLFYQAKRAGILPITSEEEISDATMELFRTTSLVDALRNRDVLSFRTLLEHGHTVTDALLIEAADYPECFDLLLDTLNIAKDLFEKAIVTQNGALVSKLFARIWPYEQALELAISRSSDALACLLVQHGFTHPNALILAVEHHKKDTCRELLNQGGSAITSDLILATIKHNELEILRAFFQQYTATVEELKMYKKEAIESNHKEIYSFLATL